MGTNTKEQSWRYHLEWGTTANAPADLLRSFTSSSSVSRFVPTTDLILRRALHDIASFLTGLLRVSLVCIADLWPRGREMKNADPNGFCVLEVPRSRIQNINTVLYFLPWELSTTVCVWLDGSAYSEWREELHGPRKGNPQTSFKSFSVIYQ